MQADILNSDHKIEFLEYVIVRSNPRIQTVGLGVMSMIASSDTGAKYMIKVDQSLRKYVEFVAQVPQYTVAHRFGLSVLYKLSSDPDNTLPMLDAKVEEQIKSFCEAFDPKKHHSFFPIFFTALAYNIFTSDATREKVGKFISRFGPVMVKLLELFAKDLPSAAHQLILDLFMYLMQTKEVYYRDLIAECRAQDTLRRYYSSLQTMFAGRPYVQESQMETFSVTIKTIISPKPKLSDKEELEQRKQEKLLEEEKIKNKGAPRPLHDFESFKDEILDKVL